MSIVSMLLLSYAVSNTALPVQSDSELALFKSQVSYSQSDVCEFRVVYQNSPRTPSSDCTIAMAGGTTQAEGESKEGWKWRLQISTSNGPREVRTTSTRSSRVGRNSVEPQGSIRGYERSFTLYINEANAIVQMLSEDFDPGKMFGVPNLSPNATLNWDSGRRHSNLTIAFTRDENGKWNHDVFIFGQAIESSSEGHLVKALSKAIETIPRTSS